MAGIISSAICEVSEKKRSGLGQHWAQRAGGSVTSGGDSRDGQSCLFPHDELHRCVHCTLCPFKQQNQILEEVRLF